MNKTKRVFRDFTEEELKIIKENSGKVNLQELSVKLNINYTNLSSALHQHRIPFKPRKRSHNAKEVEVQRTHDDEGNELLTDDHLKEWFDLKY